MVTKNVKMIVLCRTIRVVQLSHNDVCNRYDSTERKVEQCVMLLQDMSPTYTKRYNLLMEKSTEAVGLLLADMNGAVGVELCEM